MNPYAFSTQLLILRHRGFFDMVTGSMIDTGADQLLADYLLLLEQSLPNLAPEEAARLPNAIRAMVAACRTPSADRLACAQPHVKITMLEKVRQAVARNLRSPSLGPHKLCHETGMSRSQLYRVLESEGGVATYIQRRRLLASFSMLSDTTCTLPVGEIAASLCFPDPSTFSRAFRREFGIAPMELRTSSRLGRPLVKKCQKPGSEQGRMLSDYLRSH
ncbi:helix-turn-helix transcriptional regulator [Bradyrhizobium sp.]|uniref:helix-turn-helix transcriptional regulator n=1 Tax=Bradyrhizobium sp. TaxID=376 RepID=UPI001ECE175E|nr:helix-turn-helix transcriptional regulator [Bradyrhizobium sp.]MBV9481189.1 helix-turn-helix transcriptional regulator [Acidobacteriota bacterium]MBV9982864.1 helix-turn-helix transcriptional regulator [Bradyrhizobium sp.]